MDVTLKEHIETVINLKFHKVEGDLQTLEKNVERRLQDLVNSRLKFVTILASIAVIISAITLILALTKV